LPETTPSPTGPTIPAAVAAAEENSTLVWHRRLLSHIPRAQFIRYLGVGVFNTVFGYCTFALTLFLLNHIVPQRYLYLTVIAAALISTPLNITVAYFGYKFFVFKTRGDYLVEWFKCFGVYGVGMLPGLVALSAVTRLLQSALHAHGPALHLAVAHLAAHLSGRPLATLRKLSSGKAMAGYLAGALVQGFTTIFSFIGHKNVTFRKKSAA
jgi:putative flippase GtrA